MGLTIPILICVRSSPFAAPSCRRALSGRQRVACTGGKSALQQSLKRCRQFLHGFIPLAAIQLHAMCQRRGLLSCVRCRF